MDIAQYISDLLNQHSEVSLPGIGTFFKRNVSAVYNEADSTYYPPSYKIDFRSEEVSDSKLISHIVENKHISESSASYFIERFCENIKKSIEQESNASISPLGTLIKKDDSYYLESDSTYAGLGYFGLSPIKELEISQRDHALADAAAITSNVSVPSEEESTGGSKTFLIILSILLALGILAGLAYYFYPQYFKNLVPKENKEPVKKVVVPAIKQDSIQESVAFADSIIRNLEEQGLEGEVEKAPDSINITTKAAPVTQTPDTVETKPRPAKVYEVIVASFGLKREAEQSVKNLRKKGIDAKIVVDKNKPKFKVSIGTFTTMSAANKENKRVQEGVRKDSWILTVINKEN